MPRGSNNFKSLLEIPTELETFSAVDGPARGQNFQLGGFAPHGCLGSTTLLGSHFYGASSISCFFFLFFRIKMGPMSLKDYERILMRQCMPPRGSG